MAIAEGSRRDVAIDGLDVSAYEVPTDAPESDGTFEWDSTTIVVVEAHGGSERGLGYTYTDGSAGALVESKLAPVVRGRNALDVGAAWEAMSAALRNVGRPGLGFMALSAVDVALWDLKARLLDVPLVGLLDAGHDAVPIYGSGGFTSYTLARIREQLGGWVADGVPRVKMKISRDPDEDPARLTAAREAIGPDAELYVDSNGALGRKQALAWAERLRDEWDVRWFEEPVSSDDLAGLRLVRDRTPGGVDIAAGEYGDVLAYFERMLAAGAVDCLQADVTRCGGITGVRAVGAVAAAHEIDLSVHCAPAVSAHAVSGIRRLRHLEYFHDHVRLEALLFDGVLRPEDGVLRPDRSRPGLGLELKRADAEEYRL